MTMPKPHIICVDDQQEVLSSLLKDIDFLSSHFDIVECDSAFEALDVIEDLDESGMHIALIISDHVMPEMTGVEFLTKVHQDSRFKNTKKLLLTGLATHEDTIDAINNARINSYIGKPWNPDMLFQTVRSLLTHFIFDAGLSYTDYTGVIDENVIFDRVQ
jgi:two-component system chemotaxis response regulator CheY